MRGLFVATSCYMKGLSLRVGQYKSWGGFLLPSSSYKHKSEVNGPMVWAGVANPVYLSPLTFPVYLVVFSAVRKAFL